MPQDDHTNTDSGETSKKNDRTSRAGLWLILIGGSTLIVALLFLSIFLPNLTERVKFFTGNALSLLVLVIIVVQAYIYRGQWEAMQGQLHAMKDQVRFMSDSLVETRNIVTQNERSIKIAEDNMVYAQRAYVSIPAAEISRDVAGGGDEVFVLRIENSGNTPASDVRMYIVAEVKEIPPAPDADSESWVQVGLLAPRGHFKYFASHKEGITPEQRVLWQKGDLKFYCAGVIQYKDIFKQEHQTRFCFCQSFRSPGCYPCKSGNEGT